MVKLIQIDQLNSRIQGMLYKISFQEQWALLDDGARKLYDAGKALLGATHFKELLNVRPPYKFRVQTTILTLLIAYPFGW